MIEWSARRLMVPALALLASFGSSAIAGPSMPSRNEIEEANSLEGAFETPHTKWAKPYAGGRIRVLVVAQLHTDANLLPLRRAVELAQRFDIDVDAVLVIRAKAGGYATTYAGGSGVYGGQQAEERLAELLEKTYDCFVVTGPVLGHIPEQSRAIILNRVREGAGLVFPYAIGEEDQPVIAGAKPLADLPEFLDGMKARTFLLEKGRVVSYSDAIPRENFAFRIPAHQYGLAHIFGVELQRDLRFEKRGRPILWAARREPQLKLAVTLPAPAMDREELAQHPITVTWEGDGIAGPLRLDGRIRSQGRGACDLPAASDLGSHGTKAFEMPILPAGRYWVDVIARSDRGVEAWAIREFAVTSPDKVTNIKLDRHWGEAGESIEGTAEVITPHPQDRTLRVQAVDRYGRVLARQEFEQPGPDVRFSLPTDSRMPGYLGIEAALVADGDPISHGYCPSPYTIPQRKQDQWNSIMWGRSYAAEFLDIVEDALVDAGITSRIETSHVPWWHMTRAGMNYTPYCSSGLYRPPDSGPHYPHVDTEKGNVLGGAGSEGCWNDKPAVSDRLRKYLDAEMDYRTHGVLAYSMGDERTTFGSCLHPSCWKVYQSWLERRYGTIDALNESWGTSHESFVRIEPIIDKTALVHLKWEVKKGWIMTWANNEHSSLGPTHSSTAWTEQWRSMPRYVDRRAFQFWNFGNYARRFGEQARRMDPQAKIGVEGAMLRLNQDLDTIVRNTDWWVFDHEGTATEVVRSIAPPGYIYGNSSSATVFWAYFLRGSNCMFKWRTDSHLTPAMALGTLDRRLAASARIVRDGLGTLLNVRSQRLHDEIVMLHSFPSITVSQFGDATTYGNYHPQEFAGKYRAKEENRKRIHKAWHGAIRECGLQFNYTTDRRIVRDEFDASAYKVMILAQCEAIGPEVEEAIRDFVADGGTVIADVRPGLRGARGKRREGGGVLDDLFGVRHTGSAAAKTAGGRLSGRVSGSEIAVAFEDLTVNPAVEVTTGKALGSAGETPICIVNDVQKGRAILLNFAMWSSRNPPANVGRTAEFLSALFTSAGIEWPLELLDKDGHRHRNIEVMRWRTGPGIEVVALSGPTDDVLSHPFAEQGTAVIPRTVADADLETPVPAVARLPRPRYVYEMRSDRHSGGPASRFAVGVRPWWATFLVLSERKLPPPLLKPTTDVATRGEVFRLGVTIADAQGMHALKLRGRGPDGRDAPWLSRSVIVDNGAATIELPIASNEQPGTWTVTVTDLYTNQPVTASFEVE